jgi:flagellar basal-body rod protein FlgG
MLDAFYISALGLQAQKEQLDVVANNLANVGTTAFKRQTRDFATLLDRVHGTESVQALEAEGSGLPAQRLDFTQGEVHATGRALDVAIVGPGFIEVQLPGEQTGYARNGALQIGEDGALELISGQTLRADVRVPSGASDVRVLADGTVTALLAGDSDPSVLGQIELAMFSTPERLQYLGQGIFTAPDGIEPTHARPGEDGTSALVAESLEGSNIRMTEEMVSLMLMQRIYELNARVMQVADEIVGMSNNLRQG